MNVASDALVPAEQGRPVAGLLAVRSGGRLAPAARPDTGTADAYLRLSAHLMLAGERRTLRSIGVTSALRGEGKTTAALNLAVCLGRARGRQGRVLLVDADARQRTLSRMVLGAAADATEQAERGPMLFTTGFEGVDLMSAPDPQDDLAIYTPSAWRGTLADLSMRYEHVIVDCPSVLDHPAGALLRDCVEGLVLVVRSGSTSRAQVEQALAGAGRRVLGVILNAASGSRA